MVKESDPRLVAESAVLGVIGALAAQLFRWALRLCAHVFLGWMAGYRPPGLPQDGGVLKQVIGPHGLWLVPVVTTLGGLLSGLLVYTWAPEAEGHGTDTVVKAFHRAGGFIRARVAPLKLVASAITIGSGGSAGREGPTALIGAGVGSMYATLIHRADEEREILLLAGMAAGLSAIFRSPIGAAFFAIEVLYSTMEFEARALLYTLLAAIVAYAFNGFFVGWQPLFYFPVAPSHIRLLDYGWLGVLGVAGAVVATLLPVVFYRLRDLFRELPLPPALNPAIGGLAVGLIALKFPQVLGGGYGWIQETIDGSLVLKLLIVLLFLKLIAFAFTVSSGGSGGVFAPTLFVGAMLGGIVASVSHAPTAMFVVLGMLTTFGAAARVPIASLLMVTEMTGGYRLLPPAAFAVLLSYLVQTKISAHFKYKSLYEAQVAGRGQSPARYVENVQLALQLLGSQRALPAAAIGHLDLVTLLDSGLPIKMPGRKELSVGVLRPESSFVGKTVEACYQAAAGTPMEIIAILRGEDVLFPRFDTVLQENDRLVIIGSSKARSRIAEHFVPPEIPKHSSPRSSAS
ncbi:MAG TPA: chloride channel protein [Candidatus Aquilonibacter sp.]|nr:chloride channel protein [Candidatus Aquilonibacter sp.]